MLGESFLKKIKPTDEKDFKGLKELLKKTKLDLKKEEYKTKQLLKEHNIKDSGLNDLDDLDKLTDIQENIDDFIGRFNLEMFEHGLYNSFNKTYKISPLKRTPYGFKAEIELVAGLDFYTLKDYILKLQQELDCTIILKTRNTKKIASLTILFKDVDTSIPFIPHKIKPNEIYLGLDFENKPIIINCDKRCMFMIAGATGTGKTRYIYSILLSWIASSSHKDVGLFIADLAKSEFSSFRHVKHVISYAEELDQLWLIMQYLQKEMENRKKILNKYRSNFENSATNIDEYNKIQPDKKFKYLYVLIDEFSTLVPDATDTEEEKEIKEKILAILKMLAKQGRSVGMFCILAAQKATKDEIPAILKNMSAVRISFRANDKISSEVIMGDDSAVGLDDRIAVYSLNGGDTKDFLFCASLSTQEMNSILVQYVDKYYKKDTMEMMIKTLETRMELIDKIHSEQNKKKEKKENNVLQESTNLFRKPVVNYDIPDYITNPKTVKEVAITSSTSKETKKPIKNGWYALENESKKLKNK